MFGISDDLTWVTGPHSFKFGGEIRRDQIRVSFINRPNGDFTFNGAVHGQRRRRLPARECRIQFRQGSGDPNLDGSSWTYALYGQDEYRVGSRVTLNYGLRYEVNQPFAESQNHLNAFHPGQQSTVFPNAPAGLVYPGDTGVPRGTYATDKNNIAPRLGRDLGRERRRPHQRARRLGHVLRHAAGAGRLLPERHARAAVPAADRRSNYPGADPVRVTAAAAAGAGRLPARADLHRLGPRLHDAGGAALQRVAAAADRQLLGRRGRLRRIARLQPADLHGGQPDDSDPDADAAVGPRLFPAFSLVRPTFSVARFLVQRAAGERAHAAVARPERARVLHAGATPSTTCRGSTSAASRGRCCRSRSATRRRSTRRWRARRATRCSTRATASSSASATSCRALEDEQRGRPPDAGRLAGQRHHPGADRLPADRDRAEQHLADVADQSSEHDVRSRTTTRRTPSRSGSTRAASSG